MYEQYTRQALPSRNYRELVGSAICVFNSNNSFIIENILRHDKEHEYSWYELIGGTSGELSKPIKETITKYSDTKISNHFSNIVQKRNRIIHSFQITHSGEQMLATKQKDNKQFIITEEYLYDFIEENEKLSSLLHEFRRY
ncbi:selenium binding protein [Halobacillus aidingensis]|uniref:Selenium binding protein n=1 Tax=Halobacillus aidingensis TaxID=240303 RepID=A0A1H0IFK3_HALAD|nr:selenium binding protein [Halobacillus aidingensis]SDO30237.1 hypothetical protein SAMN05421677_10467 [Halobacillus aidingensis]